MAQVGGLILAAAGLNQTVALLHIVPMANRHQVEHSCNKGKNQGHREVAERTVFRWMLGVADTIQWNIGMIMGRLRTTQDLIYQNTQENDIKDSSTEAKNCQDMLMPGDNFHVEYTKSTTGLRARMLCWLPGPGTGTDKEYHEKAT
ncbi:hypothetical protein BJV82DRAFT_578139 [Fennellomyces sp. T-0311]|nr:hypothetical protein BJV82DRAFT_578139 [Fennellomyces sp. T-0311]